MTEFPQCQKCQQGVLLPFSDYHTSGASVRYKAWVCSNPACGFNLKISNGSIIVNEPIQQGRQY